MKTFGSILIFVGFFAIMGVAGNSDFYEECRAAADCVAGDPPDMFVGFLVGMLGAIAMGFGVVFVNQE